MDLKDQGEAKKPFLTREQLRQELVARGFVMSASYFSKICLPSRNEGPRVAVQWGKRPLYNLEDGLAWAEGRCKTASAAA